jgi:Zn-dependent M28 family amino/carboxypeptidase
MVLRFVAVLALLLSGAASAGVTSEQLRRHVEILASDEYEGRAPGTAGEARTIAYIAEQFRAAGLDPAGIDGGWYQPVGLVVRSRGGQDGQWAGRRSSLAVDSDRLILVGRRDEESLRNAPVVFAGHGAVMARHGIDQLAGAELAGAVVLILHEAPDVPGFPSFAERVRTVTARGAAAVIGIVGDSIPWRAIEDLYRIPRTGLENEDIAAIQGVMSQAVAERLAAAAGTDLGRLLNGAPGPAFTAVALDLRATLRVRTGIRRLASNNVIGRLRGSGDGSQSLLYLAHWDHFGICRAEGEADRICNGAVDNASGVASMIEIATSLAAGPRPKRDILFLATTAEEAGLLGAEHFVSSPPVPIASIVAALNLDTTAVARTGSDVSVVGGGFPPFDALIAQSAAELGRDMDADRDADQYRDRHDGWPLQRRGIPAAIVGGAFSDMGELGRFFARLYHRPDDEAGAELDLEGAAEDSNLLVALGRKLADPALYPPPEPLAQP